MSVLWDQTTVNRFVPITLDHTTVTVIPAIVLTVMVRIVQVSPNVYMQCMFSKLFTSSYRY